MPKDPRESKDQRQFAVTTPTERTATDTVASAPRSGGRGAGRQSTSTEDDTGSEVQTRKVHYLFAARHRVGLMALAAGPQPVYDAQQVYDALSRMPEVTVVRRIRPSGFSALSAGPGASQDVIVVATTPEHGLYLQSIAHPGMIVERDHHLNHLAGFGPQFVSQPVRATAVSAASLEITFHIQNVEGKPLPNAEIVIYTGEGAQDQQSTDASGDATLSVPGGFLRNVVALYVKPSADYWERFVSRPALTQDKANTITLRPLNDFAQARFPGNPFLGWGQRLMGLEGTDAATLSGRGVKIAIVDSGCDSNHPALKHIKIGRDFTNLDDDGNPNESTWTADALGHGTHCAGVIAGNGEKGQIRGFCPEAEIHVLKLFPGGAFNNLIAAIQYCIDNQIDVVNCSLGGDDRSEIVQQELDRAREAGVAVVVAAGNSSGPVQFPALVPSVFCVSAVGQQGEYPDDTYHAQTAQPGSILVNGLFPAKFSCHGPEVKACAPGVAVISSLPGGGYGAWDGTSMAAPAITGSAALLVAHHPEFANRSLVRNAARVDRIFQRVMAAAQPIGLNPLFGGAGLPAVPKALTQMTAAQQQPQLRTESSAADLQAAIQQGLMAGLAALRPAATF